MGGAQRAAVIVLVVVALLNIGYLVYRQVQGGEIVDSLPLLVGFVICMGVAGILVFQSRMRPPR